MGTGTPRGGPHTHKPFFVPSWCAQQLCCMVVPACLSPPLLRSPPVTSAPAVPVRGGGRVPASRPQASAVEVGLVLETCGPASLARISP